MIFIANPFADLSPKLTDIKNIISARADSGLVEVYRVSDGKQPPILKIGGRSDVLESSASREVDGTIRKTTKEGLYTNPNVLYPSSFFSAIPPMLTSLFGGPLKLMDNPELVIGLIGIVTLGQTDKDTYSDYHKELPTQIIDNQEIEDRLFGA